MRKFLPYFLFFFLSLIPFLWFPSIKDAQFLGAGDYLSPLSATDDVRNMLYAYRSSWSAGVDWTFGIAELFPHGVSLLFAHLLGLPPVAGTLIYMSSLILISQVAMYLFLARHLGKSKWGIILPTLGSVLYGFSPYTRFYIEPGQMGNIIINAFYPLLFLFTEKLFMPGKIKTGDALIIFILFSLSNGNASQGLGPLYQMAVLTVIYAAIRLLVYRERITHVITRFLLVMGVMISANIYWLLPWLASGVATSANYSSPVITRAIRAASEFTTLPNLMLLKATGLPYMRQPGYGGVVLIAFLLCAGLVSGLILLLRDRKFLLYFVVFLIILFMTKGTNPPAEGIFMALYDHMPGFAVFRRPLNKLSGMYLFFYITLALFGFRELSRKVRIGSAVIIAVSATLGLLLIFPVSLVLGANVLHAFTLPGYFEKARDDLDREGATRVVMLPGLSGIQPTFDASLNYYYGNDPLWKFWPVSTVVPDFTDYSPPYPIKGKVNAMIRAVLDGQPACPLARDIAATHILLRYNLSPSNPVELPVEDYHRALRQSDLWDNETWYGTDESGFYLVRIKTACTRPLVDVTGDELIRYEVRTESPVKKIITLNRTPETPLTVTFSDNYSPWWILLPGDRSSFTWARDMAEAPYFRPVSPNTKASGWANSWSIPDGSQTAFTLYYLPQAILSAAVVIWMAFLSVFTLLTIRSTRRRLLPEQP